MTEQELKQMMDMSRNLAHFIGEASDLFDNLEIDPCEDGAVDFEFRENLVRSLLRSRSMLQDYVIRSLEDTGQVPSLIDTGATNKTGSLH